MMCWFWYLVIAVAISVPAFYFLWRYFQGGRFTKNVRIDGKVTIITGSNAGLGKENALDFARRGARVYMACRNVQAGQAVRDQIVAETGNQRVFVLKLDLSSLQSVRDFVKEFQTRERQLDILVNNAGVIVPERRLTADGFEMQFGTNHLGHFLLTNLLLDTLKASAPSRIVTVSSSVHSSGQLRRDNLNGELSYGALTAYSQSKLANILFTRELARRLHGSGVVANSLHPGSVRTEVSRNYPILRVVMAPVTWLFYKSPRAGVQTQLACALDPELATVSGKYFADCRVRKEATQARDDEAAEWLWKESERMVESESVERK